MTFFGPVFQISLVIVIKLTECYQSERIAFAIVPDEVRYPDRIVGIALLLWSMQ